MSDRSNAGHELTPAAYERLERICLEFENAWESGRAPRIEDYLGEIEGLERSRLLRELLDVEIHFRRQLGESPSPSHYRDRFPTQRPAVEASFEEFGSREGGAGAARALSAAAPGPPVVRRQPQERVDPASSQPETVGHRSAPFDAIRTVGPYRILHKLGRGGQGLVYLAEDTRLGREVALKIIAPSLALSRSTLARFHREAEAASLLDHPGICPIYEAGEENGMHYLAMRYVEGLSLAERIHFARLGVLSLTECYATRGRDAPESDTGLLPAPKTASETVKSPSQPRHAGNAGTPRLPSTRQEIAQVLLLIEQAARALHVAHEAGLVHRDIKPGNLMVAAGDQRPVLLDFGLARLDGSDEQGLTLSGDLLGTPAYMSPEQLAAHRIPLDRRTDVYSLGATLYECIVLRPPFEAATRDVLYQRILTAPPPDPRELNPRVARDLAVVLETALEKDRDRRYQTALDFAEDLRRVRRLEPILARPAGRLLRFRRWAQRNPVLATSAILLAVLLGTVAGGSGIAALRLRAERNVSREAEADAKKARLVAQRELRDAYVAQARAARWSRRPGQRFESLEALREATSLTRDLELGHDALLELRNEVIACQSLPDLAPAAKTRAIPSGAAKGVFDAGFRRYAWGDDRGAISIVNLDGDDESTPAPGLPEREIRGRPLRFSADGRFLAVRCRQASTGLAIWDLDDRRVGFRYEFPTGTHGLPTSRAVDFRPRGGRRVAFSAPDGSVRICDLASGEEILRIPGDRPPKAIEFSPDDRRLLLVDGGTSIRVVELNEDATAVVRETRGFGQGALGNRILTALGAGGPRATATIFDASWHPTGSSFATACADYQVYVWDVDHPIRPRTILAGHTGEVVRVSFHPEGHLLASTSWDGTSRLWNPLCGTELLTVPGQAGQFSVEGVLLSDVRRDRPDAAWRVASGAECRTAQIHTTEGKGCLGFAIGRELPWLAVSCSDGVRVFDVRTFTQLAYLRIGFTRGIAFHPTTGDLITAGQYGVNAWPVQRDTRVDGSVRVGPPRILLPFADASRLALVAGGTVLAVNDPRQVHILHSPDATDFGLADENLVAARELIGLSLSPDGRWVGCGAWQQKHYTIRDARTGELEKVLPGWTVTGEFSPDGRWLVTATGPDYRIWKVASWEEQLRIEREGSTGIPGAVAFAPDSSYVALATTAWSIALVAPDTGHEIARLESPESFLLPKIATGPHGRLVLAADGSHRVQIWNLATVRAGLSEIGLDWSPRLGSPTRDETSYRTSPLQVEVDLGELGVLPPSDGVNAWLHDRLTKAVKRWPGNATLRRGVGQLRAELKR